MCIAYDKRYRESRKDSLRQYQSDWRKQNTSRQKKYEKKYYSKVSKKVEIGKALKDEIMGQPTKKNKSLWNGKGHWHRDFFACLECNTTIYRHEARGLCKKCYERLRYENNLEKERAAGRSRYRKNRDHRITQAVEYKRSRVREAEKFIELAKSDKTEKTPKIDNLLNNLDL